MMTTKKTVSKNKHCNMDDRDTRDIKQNGHTFGEARYSSFMS